MRSQPLKNRRNKLIYDQYCDLWQSGLREELIWPKLEEAFHLREKTIYRIVLKFIKTARKESDKNINLPEEPKNADN